MRVSVDADLCSGCGCCVETCDVVFTHLDPAGQDVGVAHVKQDGRIFPAGVAADVPPDHEAAVILAAEECPGEIIAIEYTGTPGDRPIRSAPPRG